MQSCTGNVFIQLTQTLAPHYFHLWILLPLTEKCPGNPLLARSVLSGRSTDAEWEPTVHQGPTSSENMEMMKRGALPLRCCSLKQDAVQNTLNLLKASSRLGEQGFPSYKDFLHSLH